MVDVGSFEDEVTWLKKNYEHGSYEYTDPSQSFNTCTSSHFESVEQRERYGVYVVRQKDTKEVLYVGKGGTIYPDGSFSVQDVPGRLRNKKNGNILATLGLRTSSKTKDPF